MSALHVSGSAYMKRFAFANARALAALDEVAREREGRAGEADERDLELLLEELDGLEDVAEALLDLDVVELVDVGLAARRASR